MKDILIYIDYGVGEDDACVVPSSLLREVDPSKYRVRNVSHKDLLETSWEDSASLLVIPGGRDIPYHEALSGAGCSRIRSFVEQGGNYLGLCAGAYFACATFDFDKGGELEVIGKRELCFFPGKAWGPAYGVGTYRYKSKFGARAAGIISDIEEFQLSNVFVYFNGGCFFESPEDVPNVNILARFADIQDTPAAVIEARVGAGKAILSGVHPEYSFEDLDVKETDLKNVIFTLQEFTLNRRIFFRYILKRMNLVLNELY